MMMVLLSVAVTGPLLGKLAAFDFVVSIPHHSAIVDDSLTD
jgi:hypothetical protein